MFYNISIFCRYKINFCSIYLFTIRIPYVCLFVSSVYFHFVNGVHQAIYTQVAQEFPPVRLVDRDPQRGSRVTCNSPLLGPEGFSWNNISKDKNNAKRNNLLCFCSLIVVSSFFSSSLPQF